MTDALSEVGVDWPLGQPMNLHLVVSNDQAQLFLVITSEFSRDISIEISEIILARRDPIPLTEMSDELMSLDIGDEILFGPFVAIRCANCILICAITGQSVAYSLSYQSWDHAYPHNNLWKALCMSNEHYQESEEVYGSNYCISLCAP